MPETIGPSPEEMGVKELKEVMKDVLMEFKGRIPTGEKWHCGTVMDSQITVSKGAELYVGEDGEVMDSKILLEKGGRYTNEGVDMGNKVEEID